MKSSVGIFIGTGIQENICEEIIGALYYSKVIDIPAVTFHRFYHLGLNHSVIISKFLDITSETGGL